MISEPKNVAVVFPGQGSQFVGMLSELSSLYPSIQKIFAEASQVLGYDLWALTQSGPAEQLDQTIYTQPAILTASYALWQILSQQSDFQPVVMAGHSLGEYSALVCAGALTFSDAVRLVSLRGQYMQEAVPEGIGALAVIIGLDEVAIQKLCEQAREKSVLAPANFNSPGQIVIAGHAEAVERAIQLAKNFGAKMAKRLPVSVPSHCDLMKPAAQHFEKILAKTAFFEPSCPVINNVDVQVYKTAEQIREGLLRQLYSPVRWIETVVALKNDASQVIECGPGKVLSGLIKRIDGELRVLSMTELLGICMK